MAMRCFCPLLRRTPRSPNSVAYPSGKASINPSATAGRWSCLSVSHGTCVEPIVDLLVAFAL